MNQSTSKMKNNSLQIMFAGMFFVIACFVEVYLMLYYEENYILLSIVAFLSLLCLIILINGVITMMDMRNKIHEAQFEEIIKSEKATYILSKKNCEELLDRLRHVERSAMIPTGEIVSAQKGIAKVIISRNRESAEAMKSSNEQMIDLLTAFETKLMDNNQVLIDKEKQINADTMQQIVEKIQDLLMDLRDMELRLNASITQSQKVIMTQQPYIEPQATMPVYHQPLHNNAQYKHSDLSHRKDENQLDAMLESLNQPSSSYVSPARNDNMPPEMPVAVEPVPSEDVDMGMNDLAELISNVDTDTQMEDEFASEIFLDDDIQVEDEEIPPMPDLSDPNKVMSPDDIDALLASMNADMQVEEKEEIPPMPDLSDPNKMMSPDDIAALIANTTATTEVEEKEVLPPMPDLSDPNKMMSPDDIDALIANMNADTQAEKSEIDEISIGDLVSLDDVQVEEKPPMPDLSDPNKMMSPDDIAALIANMTS